MIKEERGMVLLTILLFLIMVTVLVFAVLNTSLLETKMSSSYLAKMKLFYAAEGELKEKERELLANPNQPPLQQTCGVDFYRVAVDAGDASSGTLKLQSTVAKVGDVSKCDPKPKVQTGRQSWRINN